jgi:hypothetical protein
METKVCLSCQNTLTLDKFQKRTDTQKYRNQCKECRTQYVKQYKTERKNETRTKKQVVVIDNHKKCVQCGSMKPLESFPRRKTEHGSRHECTECKQVNMNVYYQEKYNEVRRQQMKDDVNKRLKRAQRNYIYKCLTKNLQKTKKSADYLHCSVDMLKEWLEYQFVEDMSWENYGKIWTIDHVLPLSQFELTDENQRYIAFDWKNLQPSKVNFEKSDKVLFSEYIKVTMKAHRFIQENKIGSSGYQGVSNSLHWLRDKLRYGKNPTDVNGQPATK